MDERKIAFKLINVPNSEEVRYKAHKPQKTFIAKWTFTMRCNTTV